jgi:WD40 repeat protein
VENYYQVGGSLRANRPSYVIRSADRELFKFLETGEYCFVLNSRQMGKSSLRVRTGKKLRSQGIKCAFLDLTLIGTHASQEQWYKGIATQLIASLELDNKIDLDRCWKHDRYSTEIQKLQKLIEVILLQTVKASIVIFIDEIDSLIKIPFKDDFFAFIRACYNLRAENAEYNRLSFCLLGVASPTDLIHDKGRTPFNIGKAIALTGLTFSEAQTALVPGLKDKFDAPEDILKQVLAWTCGQPFLTQKLCSLLVKNTVDRNPNIAEIVKNNFIQDWESQDEPEHFRTIRDRLLIDEKRSIRLLSLYQQILEKNRIPAEESDEQTELRLSGLVVKKDGYLEVYNPIYQKIFDRSWLEKHLDGLRPYSEAINCWRSSDRESKCLLVGKALEDALTWARDRSLSDLDYQFLSASRSEQDRKANQILAEANQKAKQTIRRGGIILSVTSLVSILLALSATFYARQQLKNTQKTIQLEKAGIHAQEQFQSQQLEGLRAAIDATQNLKTLTTKTTSLKQYQTVAPLSALLNILNQISEKNILEGHKKAVKTVVFSADGSAIASGSLEGTLKLWKRDGRLIKTIPGNNSIASVRFSPDGNTIAVGNEEGKLILWKRDGTRLKTFSHGDSIYAIAFSGDGKIMASTGKDGTIKLWSRDGSLVKTIGDRRSQIYSLSLSRDGETIAAGDRDGMIFLWKGDGTFLKRWKAHSSDVNSVVFSPDGKAISSGGGDNLVKIWNLDGKAMSALKWHRDSVMSVDFSPDGQTLVSGGLDNTISLWLWSVSDRPIATLSGRDNRVYSVSFSPDGEIVASGNGYDLGTAMNTATIQLWQWQRPSLPQVNAHNIVTSVVFNPSGDRFASSGMDGTIKFWQLSPSQNPIALEKTLNTESIVNALSFSADGGQLIVGNDDGTIALWRSDGSSIVRANGHQGAVTAVSASPDGKLFASGSDDGTISLWDSDGKLVKTFVAHQGKVTSLSFHPDGKLFASGSDRGTISLWDRDGIAIETSSEGGREITSLSFSPDGKILAAAKSDGAIELRRDDKTSSFLVGQGMMATTLKFSPDGLFAVGYGDGTVKLWQSDGTLMLTLNAYNNPVTGLDFSPNAQTLITSSRSGQITIWNLGADTLLARGCNWLKDYLTSRPRVRNSLSACLDR